MPPDPAQTVWGPVAHVMHMIDHLLDLDYDPTANKTAIESQVALIRQTIERLVEQDRAAAAVVNYAECFANTVSFSAGLTGEARCGFGQHSSRAAALLCYALGRTPEVSFPSMTRLEENPVDAGPSFYVIDEHDLRSALTCMRSVRIARHHQWPERFQAAYDRLWAILKRGAP
jgi:hypothetical protein